MARRGGGHDGGAHGHPARGSGHRHHVLRQGGGARLGAERRVTVTAKGEYAIKAMLDLALTDDGETLQPIQDIARRQGIPQRYLSRCSWLSSARAFSTRAAARRAVTVSPR